MQKEQGNLSINSENIFPIIKKWLYSDHDIFVRELVSNGCDAITKLGKLEIMGEFTKPEDYKEKITVTVNAEDKTITFEDNGIGMTDEEVKEYINQIAFSGAADFLEKYKDRANEDQIIGHFGLGFYSAFMVADTVEIDTRSYQDGATPVHWISEGGDEFEMTEGNKESFGTTITLHLNEESYEFSNEYRIREILTKYCSFMPVEIYLVKANAEQEYEVIDEDQLTDDDVVVEHIVKEEKKDDEGNEQEEKEEQKEQVKINKRPVSLSDTKPLWTKHPNDCTDEEYKDFYRKVFHDYKEPLFWIHLNMDYPFNLKGILYFPKLNTEYDNLEGMIKLYNNQVFIADNIKEVIPEFLMLLKGVIDCPDLPLNVSRSALQNDGFVKKISDYITKKVADKLSGMFKVDREAYEKYWDDISPFIKYGCLKDEKFGEKIKDSILFKDLEGKYISLNEYLKDKMPEEPVKEETEDKPEPKPVMIYYVTDEVQQSQYINMFKEQGLDAFILSHNIDQPFISHCESIYENVKFQRIDAQLTDDFVEETSEDELKEQQETLTDIFKKALNKENLLVEVKKMKNDKVSSMITLSEEARRMQDMMKMYAMQGMGMGMDNMDENGITLVLNANNHLVSYILDHKENENVSMICEQLYDLAMLCHRPLAPEAMTKFVERSNKLMQLTLE